MKTLFFGLKFLIFNAVLLIGVAPSMANAGVLFNAPKYFGLQNGLAGYWSFDGSHLSRTTAEDQSGKANHGTLTGNPLSTIGRIGQALAFDGVGAYVSVGNVSAILQSVSFWIKGNNINQKILDLNGTASIEVINGTITANGFTSPRILVNGVQGSTITTAWQQVTVVTDTSINASAVDLGRISTGYFSGTLDDVRVYTSALSSDEVKRLYNTGR